MQMHFTLDDGWKLQCIENDGIFKETIRSVANVRNLFYFTLWSCRIDNSL